ncbi:hypothetical protein [Rathayibacter tanaceti]|uniref:hypothetical protein n=1 Tax=Rathayibacter tanaceti TaxID=1671680 RepID=UPI001F2E70CC|nr:hypothetical protein [Rathayibacter tanaceti]
MDPLLLDRLAADAWPALVRRPLGAWELRASAGVTKRANSLLASGDVADQSAALDAAERVRPRARRRAPRAGRPAEPRRADRAP